MSSIYRRYRHSSSFKMAVLFTALLGVGIIGWVFVMLHYGEALTQYPGLKIALIVGLVMMILVIAISFLISVFVVKGINDIARTADIIMQTADFSQRIDVNNRWDDLSNMSFVLNELFEKIEHLMSDIKSVSDNIAHDLRTPLTRLLNNLKSLEQGDAADKKQRAIFEGEQLLRTFNALLRISYIEYGKTTLNSSRFDFKQLVQDVVDLYEPLAESKGLHINTDLKKAEIYGDKDLLFQAVANVIDNAIKYTDQGEISISLNQSNNIHLKILDSGPGILEQNREKIFDRFFREDEARITSGNGLGLALTKVVIEKHGGEVMAKNNQTNGLVIKVKL